jgi:hypothetical protein
MPIDPRSGEPAAVKAVYLLLCVLGAAVPYVPFVQWLQANAVDAQLPARFAAELFSTRIGAFFGLDVILSAITLFVFVIAERRNGSRARIWTVVMGTLLVGVSLGLPLYLYERERGKTS